jgi:predicted membrane protein
VKYKGGNMNERKTSFLNGKVIVGILIIAAGLLLLLGTLGYDMAFDLWDFWPLILIAVGVKIMVSHYDSKEILWGFFVFTIGILFQLRNLDFINFHFRDIWPLILIYIGIQILITGKRHGSHEHRHKVFGKDMKDEEVEGDRINVSAILGGGEYHYSSRKLKGGKISAIMGGCEIDLRDSDFEGDEMVINTFALMGGIDMRIPQNWNVVLDGTPILGGMSDKTKTLNGSKKKLIITGEAIMGGVEIKN